jgi:hypothetical protein
LAEFGPLTTAYRKLVEQLLRGGSNTVGKEHFTILYEQARDAAFTSRSIRSGWSKAGLYPFNPDKVLREVKPPADEYLPQSDDTIATSPTDGSLQTPVTPTSLCVLSRKVDQDTDTLDNPRKVRVKKLIKAAERAIAKGTLFRAEFDRLRKQNDEKKTRQSTKVTVVGDGRVMSYEEIRNVQSQRRAKEVDVARRGRKHPNSTSSPVQSKRSRVTEESEQGEHEGGRMEDYCTILQF